MTLEGLFPTGSIPTKIEFELKDKDKAEFTTKIHTTAIDNGKEVPIIIECCTGYPKFTEVFTTESKNEMFTVWIEEE